MSQGAEEAAAPAVSVEDISQALLDGIAERVAAETAASMSEYELIIRVVLLSLFVERGLAVLFETRIALRVFESYHGGKSTIAFLVSWAACAIWDLDAPGLLLGEPTDPNFRYLGYFLTGAVVAGGSKASIRLFQDYLDVKGRFKRQFDEEHRRRLALAKEDVNTVLEMQSYLTRFGYLKPGSAEADVVTSPEVIPGELDDATQKAIRSLQARLGLPETGALEPNVVALLRRPRCGEPDRLTSLVANQPYPVDKRSFTWQLQGHPPLFYPSRDEAERVAICSAAIQSAFDTWRQVLGSRWSFAPVETDGTPDIRFRFAAAGQPGVRLRQRDVARASFYRETEPQLVEFDMHRAWSNQGVDNCYDFETVALHEIGHCLGIAGHVGQRPAVMAETLDPGATGVLRNLETPDEQKIRTLYARREET